MRAHMTRLLLGLLLVLCILMVACGGGKPVTYQALNVASAAPPQAYVGISYGFTFTATGGKLPYTWSISAGSLPAGLTLNTSSGAISGTPTNAAAYTFTVECTDSQTPTAAVATRNFTMTVKTVTALSISTKTLTTATINAPYTTTLVATGGVSPYTWTIDSGSLPAGLTLSAAGVISGTPTALGTSTFEVKVTDSQATPATATQVLTLTVNNPQPLMIITTSLPNALNGISYSQTLFATGGVTPYTWSVVSGTLPTGLILSSAGVITGTTTALGTYNFTVQVKDTEPTPMTATAALTLMVTNIPPLQITTTTLVDATIGVAYFGTLSATGGNPPYTWSLVSGSLPAGLSLSTSGVITGTPTATGASTFTVKVTDTEPTPQTAMQQLTLTVDNPPPLKITTTTLPNGTVNVLYSQFLQATGGTPPYTWSVSAGSLPTGLSLTSTGNITGTPTQLGTSSFTVQAQDSATLGQQTATAPLTIIITSLGNSLLSGNYAFLFNGFSNGSPIFMAGSLVSDGNGNITSGALDMTSSAGPVNASLTPSTYSIDDSGFGTVTLDAGTLGTFTLQVAAPASHATISFILNNQKGDSTGTYGSGSFLQQYPTYFDVSYLTGNYVFGLYGVDQAGARLGRIGFQTIASGAISAGTSDVNDAGTLTSVTTPMGTYGAIDTTTGRGMVTFNDSNGTTTYVAYMVSPNQVILLEAETALPAPMIVGLVQKQTLSNAGGNTLSGNTVIELSGLSGTAPDVAIGRPVFVAATGSTFTATLDENNGGTLTQTGYTGGFAVDQTTGRVTFNGTSPIPATMFLSSPEYSLRTGQRRHGKGRCTGGANCTVQFRQ